MLPNSWQLVTQAFGKYQLDPMLWQVGGPAELATEHVATNRERARASPEVVILVVILAILVVVVVVVDVMMELVVDLSGWLCVFLLYARVQQLELL